jgi:Domain of unknown function (DUF4234)
MTAAYSDPMNGSAGVPPPYGPAGSFPQQGLYGAWSRQMKGTQRLLGLVGVADTDPRHYGLVWYYKIHKEMLQFDPRQPIKPAGSLLTIMFGWIIIVPPFVSYFNTGNRIANAQRAAGLTPTANPWIGFILLFIFGLTPLYYQFELNKVVERYAMPAGTQVALMA